MARSTAVGALSVFGSLLANGALSLVGSLVYGRLINSLIKVKPGEINASSFN
jgi:hypothetical protein